MSPRWVLLVNSRVTSDMHSKNSTSSFHTRDSGFVAPLAIVSFVFFSIPGGETQWNFSILNGSGPSWPLDHQYKLATGSPVENHTVCWIVNYFPVLPLLYWKCVCVHLCRMMLTFILLLLLLSQVRPTPQADNVSGEFNHRHLMHATFCF